MVFGLREAWRLAGPRMGLLMAAMMAVIGAFVWWTVRKIRQEFAQDARSTPLPRGREAD